MKNKDNKHNNDNNGNKLLDIIIDLRKRNIELKEKNTELRRQVKELNLVSEVKSAIIKEKNEIIDEALGKAQRYLLDKCYETDTNEVVDDLNYYEVEELMKILKGE